ncbi:MAG: sterol desaturase family protein [Cytophagales bacterium]|nr:sterol desaturase family protein [Cytophagales bacterium]
METLIDTFIKLTTINIIRYFLVAGIPFGLFYILFPEKFAHLKIQAKRATSSDFYREIVHSIQTAVVFGLISIVVLHSPMTSYTLIYRNISEYAWWWIPVSVLLALVFHDTYFYWMHRFMHSKWVYKHVHLVHHKSTNPSPWASYSFHILEGILEGMVIVPLVMIIPMHPLALAIFIFFGFMINVYGHLGFEILPNRFQNSAWFKILNTSVYHNMHHSHVQGNYSLYFRHWDKWMKTENVKYESYYQATMDKRKVSDPVPSKNSIFKKVALSSVFLLTFNYFHASAQIEGKWKVEGKDAIVQVYKKNNLYYAKVIDAGNVWENQILSTREIHIFSALVQKSPTVWCCGNVYNPYKDFQTEGVAELVSAERLKLYSRNYPDKGVAYFRKI